ncbi:hypothetical protein [Azospirillum argentinense]|uniref:AAA family ATPase n=1 Tax=Azospirillum argentinense TaxID=2970906 RepID=UPI0032E00A5A
MIGINGAHRSGKSTLAKALSERLGLPYLDANVTPELLARGFDQVAPMSAERRLACQEMRLELFAAKIAAAPRPCITDRSFLDIAAYSLAELTRMQEDPALGGAVAEHVERCVHLTRLHFDHLIALRPLAGFEIADGHAPPNRGYQDHIQFLVDGMMLRCSSGGLLLTYLPYQDHAKRIAVAGAVIADRLAANAGAGAAQPLH